MANTETKSNNKANSEDLKANPKSILAQISDIQNSLEDKYYRVEVLEKALAYKEMTMEEREKMEAELEAIKKLLVSSEDALKTLHTENRKTVSVAGIFGLLCLAIFFVYQVVSNTIA